MVHDTPELTSPVSPAGPLRPRGERVLRLSLFSLASVLSGLGLFFDLAGSLLFALTDIRLWLLSIPSLIAWVAYFRLGVGWIANRRAGRFWVIGGTAAALLALSDDGTAFFVYSPWEVIQAMLNLATLVAPAIIMALWLVAWHLDLEPSGWIVRRASSPRPMGRRLASALAAVLIIVAGIFFLLNIYNFSPLASIDDASLSSMLITEKWPLDASQTTTATLRVPAAFTQAKMRSPLWNWSGPTVKPAQENQYETQLALYGVWPDLSPDFKAIETERGVPGGGRTTNVLLTANAVSDRDGKHYDHLQIHYGIAYEFSVDSICVNANDFPDFPNVIHEHKCYSRSAPDDKPSQFGLQRIGVDFARYPDMPPMAMRNLFASDIYTDRDDRGRLKTVIICTAEEAESANVGGPLPLVPQCQQMFDLPQINTFVEVHYRRVYLKDWQAIQGRWSMLISSFVTPALTHE